MDSIQSEWRSFVISVLDSDSGISERSFAIINSLAEKHAFLRDVVLACEHYADGHFLFEGDAERLRNATPSVVASR